jgi:hypothetical protein
MLNGLLVAESLCLGAELCIGSLSVTRVTRRDGSSSATATQPSVWTFPDFEAEGEAAADVAHSLRQAAHPAFLALTSLRARSSAHPARTGGGSAGSPPVWGLALAGQARYIRLHVRTGGCP